MLNSLDKIHPNRHKSGCLKKIKKKTIKFSHNSTEIKHNDQHGFFIVKTDLDFIQSLL